MEQEDEIGAGFRAGENVNELIAMASWLGKAAMCVPCCCRRIRRVAWAPDATDKET
jgi:hypothetical protein